MSKKLDPMFFSFNAIKSLLSCTIVTLHSDDFFLLILTDVSLAKL